MAWLEGLAQDDWRMYHSDSEVQEIARNAFELLKEQEAVEPNVAFTRVNGTKAFSCPRCSALIYGGSYCSHCGQALKGGEL